MLQVCRACSRQAPPQQDLHRPIQHPIGSGKHLSILPVHGEKSSAEAERELEIILVDDQNEQDLPDDVLADLEAGQPSELNVIKEVR
jgi:hypothetical protein